MSVMWAVSDTRDFGTKHAQRGLAEVDFGSGEAAEVEAPVLWPYHAALMTTSTLMFVANYFLLAKRGPGRAKRFPVHCYNGTAAIALAIVGLTIGFIMVAGQGQGHLRVVHAFIGATTLVVGLLILVLGWLYYKTKKYKRATRRPHMAAGAVGIAMMVVTVVSGLMYVFP
jgi:hypothetical protein